MYKHRDKQAVTLEFINGRGELIGSRDVYVQDEEKINALVSQSLEYLGADAHLKQVESDLKRIA